MTEYRESKSFQIAYSRAAMRGDSDRMVEMMAVPRSQRATWTPKRRRKATEGRSK